VLNYRSLDVIFRALADPTRRLIIEHLCDEEAAVSCIAEPLPISLGEVLRHLRTLEAGGLIRTQKSGRVRTCSVEPQALRLLDQWITQRRSRWERRQPHA
jgi:DNA-binding transcriptional ArsR family regulator